ncbi:beta strand repeat-containing protein [Bradyrhizobium icense]|uniref:Filamentous haemagglutinin FhaB/tRNA nuclease CdiA-like TPS domain-containing protein n=1 Tax=Bradyrhizobium icense TaxID=1274631 RepID=A0A1B1UFC9_9BRAD|nr:MBG domain-containing protein [Bradyrhizobium icense]ANW01474.1 hypothetical protein LMTR13_16145 [Bradyrhizobium icense]
MAQSLPTGGTVVSGNVAIGSTSPTNLTITQSSPTGIVNWSSFSVGQGNQVQFNNGSGATLNRVTGNVPSSINGVVSATGSVYLVNPSGIVVGPTGVVKTGGSFVASTLDVRDADFRAGGSLSFSGNSNASVVNLGKIGSSNGDVVLVARQVRNEGSLTARNGAAAMASGSEVVLSDGSLGNGKVLVRRPAQNGEIRNSGAIRAAEVELRANGGNIYALAGNTGRAISATGFASKGGRIFLTAEGGSVNVTQKVVARRVQADVAPTPPRAGVTARRSFSGGDVVVSADKVVVGGAIAAKGRNGAGGTVVVTGKDVTLTSGAKIDAGGTSGGTVLIGGDRAGGSNAALKFLPQVIANAQTTTIEAGATITANGTSGAGGNVVVWSDGTTSFGGTIGAAGLRGGFIETSGHQLNFAGGSIDAGRGGTWLLDPVDLTIDATLAGTIATALNGGSDVTQETNASGGGGDITVASGISWSTGATLTLSAYRNIAVNANITSTGGGGVVLRADNAGAGTGTVTFGGGQVSTAGTVSIFYNPTGSSSTVNSTKYTAPTQTNFSGNVTGGATLKAYMLVNNVFDLQNMKNNLASTYALGRDIDAGITSGWNSGAGFEPIGAGTGFTGSLNGEGHTISGLFINRITQNVGLIGYLGTGGSVTSLGVIGATVTGRTAVGAVVGTNYGAVTNVYSSGGSITATEAGAGGLVGYNFQIVSNAYSNSIVSGPLYVGGAIGLNNVANLGGSLTAGSISQIYATGAVSGTGASPSAVGGLVGFNGGSVTASYWDTYASGQASAIGSGSGSVTAVTSDPAQSAAANYAFKQTAYGSFSFPGTGSTDWFMIDGQTRPFGRWEYQTTITNAHQLQLMAMDLGASYTLARDIDVGPALAAVGGKYPGMWSQAGFSPIGDLSNQFTGNFDGQGHVISNLMINRSSTNYVGLFGYSSAGAALRNVSLQTATIAGAARVGTLAGLAKGPVSNASATGTVMANSYGGGLLGENGGSLANSWAAVTVAGTTASSSSMGGLSGWNNGGTIQDSYATGNAMAGTGGTRAGGLAGQNNGSIFRSYATGAVSGGSQGVGGLVGYNSSGSTLADSYATGAVTATGFGGGLLGINSVGASVSNSYATGAVTVTSATLATVFGGGLVGSNSGVVTKSYATGAVDVASTSAAATSTSAGGLIGSNGSTATLTQSYATGAASATSTAGSAMAGGLIGNHGSTGTVTQTYAIGAANAVSTSGATAAGGLVGSVTGTGAITSSYWDTDTSGRVNAVGSGSSAGITGLTTSQMQNPANYASTYAGWDFATVWSAPSIGYYPQLYGVNYVLRVDPANASRVYGDANPALTYSIYGLHAGDTAAIITGLSVSTAATATSNVGTYAISASGGSAVSVSGQAYRFVDAPGALTVTPRAITATADAKSRAYGDANPALTYQIGGAGLVNGDALAGALATSATASSNAGIYGITQGTLAASSNYAFTFVGANLTITPTATPRVPLAELGSYMNSRAPLPAPRPPEQMRESASIEQSAPAIICKSRQCLALPHPDNRRIGARARFVDADSDRLPAFVDN